MTAQTAVQLYALKGPWAEDRTGTLAQVAALGIAGVEAAGVGEANSFRSERLERARLLREQVADAGLALTGVHTILPTIEESDWLFEEVVETGAPIAISSTPERVLGFPRDVFSNRDRLLRFADRFNALAQVAAGHGIGIGYHNHWFEWEDLGGTPAFDVFVNALDPSIALEIDLFWAQSAGQDLGPLLTKWRDRVRYVHVKDGDGVLGAPQVAAGTGGIDLESALVAGDGSIEWEILELDVIADDADIWDVVGDGARWLTRRRRAAE
ncbi:sugar phosphate isomerase/epimerase family protein [Leifsonia sp. NPDC058194]|uniref:sugar phosphate isomerase/epimerase family protein n=1 Tax=Leifsonia sp. NPDC058194 TaxID=3346374 RepID=UPI0036DEA688